MKDRILKAGLLLAVLLSAGCTEYAAIGQVIIETTPTGISRIIRPKDGRVGMTGPGTSHIPFDTKIWTFQVEVNASTKDNAAVKVNIQARILPPQTDEDIKAHVNNFGLQPDERSPRLGEFLTGVMNTQTKNAITEYEAYGLLANQEAIQKKLFDVLKGELKAKGWMSLESIEVMGRPDFLDDRIENAASAVVANQKEQEAAQARLAAAKIEAERKEVESRTFANPAMFELEKYRIANQAQVEIEKARAEGMARHQGALTVVTGQQSLQLPLK